MPFMGLFMILYSAVVYTSKTQFPGINALLPCLGTALLLTSEKSFLSRVLKMKGLVFIGLLSYSIYLVHWPVIIFFKSIFSVYSFNIVHSLIVILISIALSLPLYYFIEKNIEVQTIG
jgi:peptidoglycan/LPS O-acetylase OafA/YrhL